MFQYTLKQPLSMYFQTVDFVRGRVTTDIIVIYSLIPVEPRMGVR